MLRTSIFALAATLAIAAEPAFGWPCPPTSACKAGDGGNTVALNGISTSNALTPNALTQNALTQNALTGNALTDNALTDNALTDNALRPAELRLVGESSAPVATDGAVVLRLIGIELPAAR